MKCEHGIEVNQAAPCGNCLPSRAAISAAVAKHQKPSIGRIVLFQSEGIVYPAIWFWPPRVA